VEVEQVPLEPLTLVSLMVTEVVEVVEEVLMEPLPLVSLRVEKVLIQREKEWHLGIREVLVL
tara:strand:+ start:743 stop:928 length:186 start_codon:yes stop_codon:yes gene_type:complete